MSLLTTCPSCWGRSTGCAYCSGTGTVADVQLSPHFRLSELLASQTAVRQGIRNAPTDAIEDNLQHLCAELLEPLRDQFGAIHVNSGYRSPALNAAISGSSSTSVHPLGHAADLVALDPTVSRKAIVDWVVASALPFDQVIFEGTWVHLSRRAPDGVTVRRQALAMFPGLDGQPHYGPYDPSDPRTNA